MRAATPPRCSIRRIIPAAPKSAFAADDDFHFKVSPDGATFYEGLRIGRANGAVDFLAGEDAIPSAATVNIGASTSLAVQITGTMTIASLGTAANKLRFVRFAGALTLTHNAASLILLGGASRTTAAGDVGVYRSDAGGNWREIVLFARRVQSGATPPPGPARRR